MWMCNPTLMCDRHLNGEHNEIHKYRHNFVKGHSIKKRIELDQIEPHSMKTRHDELAKEINRRAEIKGTGGHKSPYELPDLSNYPNHIINRENAKKELIRRCENCRKAIKEVKNAQRPKTNK